MKQDNLLAKAQGCLLGLAIGDAVGTTLEFERPGTFVHITDMTGGGPFDLKPGQWTDDTSMALCLAHSLTYNKGFNAEDQMNRYCNWWQYGYMSSTGDCFDIGLTVSTALQKYLDTKQPFCGDIDPRSAGNGSLMRLAPIPIFYSNQFEEMIGFAGESSRTTHGTAECIDACKYYASLIFSALNGADKESIVRNNRYSAQTPAVLRVSSLEYLSKSAEEIKGTGYVIDSLEASLWSFATTNSFEEAILKAANLGDDADTTAAITGQLAGAYYGISEIPTYWKEKTYWKNDILELAEKLIPKTP